jgi:hypothetical protein
VEIRYEGVVIDRITGMSGSMEQGGVLQLRTAEPMPVGTRLELRIGSEVSFVRVVRVTEAAASEASIMHVRAAGLTEPFEVTLLPNPEYFAESRARAEIPWPPEPPAQAPPAATPAAEAEVSAEAQGSQEAPSDGQAILEPIGGESSVNGAGEHSGSEEISGLLDSEPGGEMPDSGNGAVNKRRRRRRR